MNLTSPDTQQELLRFLELMDTRINELYKERDAMARGVATLEARLFALERQRGMALDIKREEERKKERNIVLRTGKDAEGGERIEDSTWIHINDCRQYPQLPQPSTVRQWIRQGKLKEGSHFKRLGARNKIYLNVPELIEVTNCNG